MKRFRNRIAMMTAVVLAVCSGVTVAPAQAENVTLKLVMVAYTEEMVPFYRNLESSFEAANAGINLEIDVASSSEIGQKVRNLITSGQSPDLVNSDEFTEEASAGLLYRADEIVSAEVLKDMFPAFIDNSKYKGTAFAVPALASARTFAWNKKLFAGSKVKGAPATWTQMREAAKAVKKKYPDVYPYCLALGGEQAHAIFTTWGGLNGGRLFTKKTNKYTLNSKRFKDALDFLKSLVDQKLTQPNPGTTNLTDGCWTLFAEGKVAMVDSDLTLPGWLQKNGGATIDIALTPLPHATGKKSVTVSDPYFFKGYKANGRKVEIQKFLNFLFEPANFQSFMKASGSLVPPTLSATKFLDTDPNIRLLAEVLPNTIFYPKTVSSWQACKSVITTYMGNAMSSTSRALQQIQARCDAAQRRAK